MTAVESLPARDLLAQPFSAADFARAAQEIYTELLPTPQLAWPLLAQRCGCEVWVKHENHLPTGAFKVRGGLWFMQQLSEARPTLRGVVAATRGNHGQSIGYAAHLHDLRAVIVVPHGNNPDKNRAMQALGVELIEHGEDFNAALDYASALAVERGLYQVPSFHPLLVQGVGTYGYELFRAIPDLDAVYVPIGLGSGIAGVLAARNALGLNTEIIGVVSAHADAYAQSFERGEVVSTARADTLADGLAVRVPSADALRYLRTGVTRVVRVSDDEVLQAIAALFADTHNLVEGAGAAPLAALLKEREQMAGRRVALVVSGGNIDRVTLARALNCD
jgi:threonine dehydratase